MQIPRRRSDEFNVRDDGPLYLTEEGSKRLKEKLAHLKSALPNFIAEAQRTAAYGDRSDSAEYKDAKSTLRRTHRQILNIQDQIKRVVIIKTGPNTSGKVQLGSTVLLEIMDSARSPQAGEQKTFQIVGPQETNPDKGRISYQSPLGAALMSHGEGDSVTIETGSGRKEYRILEIK